MLINFTQVIKDSINFIRNQLSISIKFTIFFFVVAMLINYLVINASPENIQLSDLTTNNKFDHFSPNTLNHFVYLGFIQLILNLFISAWGIFTIHLLSERANLSLVNSMLLTLKRFIGFLFISAIITIPLLIGSAEIIISYFTNKSASPFSFVTTAIGLFIFVRLNIAPVDYLVNKKTISGALKHMWLLGTKNNFPLFIYFVINDILLRILGYEINALLNGQLITLFIVSLLAVFSLIFTYRFYSKFTQKA